MSFDQQAAGQRLPTAPPMKFKWTDDTSVMLLKEVGNNKAHIPLYGEQEKHFVQVVECLNKRGVQVKSIQTCQRHFKKLLKSFLKKDEADVSASGKEPNDEGEPDWFTLMRDLLEEIQEFNAEKETLATHTKMKEDELVAGEDLRAWLLMQLMA